MTTDTASVKAQDAPTVEDLPTGDTAERSNLLRQAYGAATTRLREEHREEFDKFYSEEAEKRGVEYTPRLTPEQKAEQEFQRLLETYPHLAEKAASKDA